MTPNMLEIVLPEGVHIFKPGGNVGAHAKAILQRFSAAFEELRITLVDGW